MAHILLPTDLSTTSFKAATFAFDLFGTAGNRYTLVHSFLQPAFDNALLPAIGDRMRRDAENALRRVERRCRKHAGKVILARRATPYQLVDVLNELVEDKGGDLIVMGAQGEGGAGLVGSNTKAVVGGALAPVITVPHQWMPSPVSRILLAHDGGPLDRFTMGPLIDVAGRSGAEVVIAHVRSTIASFDTQVDRKQVAELLGAIPHSFVTVQGDAVAATINELASTGRVQLVAVVHRQRGFWEGLFHSSKATRMALHTSVPLLVMPERP